MSNKRQVMQNAIAHHPLTDGLAAIPPPGQLTPVYILSMMYYGVEYPFR